MQASPLVSIILCTRNRAGLLRGALESMLAIELAPTDFELLVVDNGSSDGTEEVIRAFESQAEFSVRYCFEPQKGLSCARNHGIVQAHGQFLFFTDDDQLLCPTILREHLRIADQYSGRVQQGCIELRFEHTRPAWLRGDLCQILGQTKPRREGPGLKDLYGGNMFITAQVFQELSGFREELGKGRAGYAEDTELGHRLRNHGESIVFAPQATVYHLIGPDRSTPDSLRRIAFDKGLAEGRAQGHGRLALWTKALCSVLVVMSYARWLIARLHPDTHWGIRAETKLAFKRGLWRGLFDAEQLQ